MFKELQLYGEAQAVVQVNASQESEFVSPVEAWWTGSPW